MSNEKTQLTLDELVEEMTNLCRQLLELESEERLASDKVTRCKNIINGYQRMINSRLRSFKTNIPSESIRIHPNPTGD